MAKLKPAKGIMLMEVIVALGVFMLVAPAVMILILGGFKGTVNSQEKLQALVLAEEGIEAVRAMREVDWTTIPAGTHGLRATGGQWEFAGTSEPLEAYHREITIIDLDSNRKEVNSKISWAPTHSVVL